MGAAEFAMFIVCCCTRNCCIVSFAACYFWSAAVLSCCWMAAMFASIAVSKFFWSYCCLYWPVSMVFANCSRTVVMFPSVVLLFVCVSFMSYSYCFAVGLAHFIFKCSWCQYSLRWAYILYTSGFGNQSLYDQKPSLSSWWHLVSILWVSYCYWGSWQRRCKSALGKTSRLVPPFLCVVIIGQGFLLCSQLLPPLWIFQIIPRGNQKLQGSLAWGWPSIGWI